MRKLGKDTEKELLYFLFVADYNTFTCTHHPQVKKQRYLNLADSGCSNKHLCENCNIAKFWMN